MRNDITQLIYISMPFQRTSMLSLRNAVERFGTSPAEAYVCRSCDEQFELQRHVCPACGGFSVDAVRDVRGH